MVIPLKNDDKWWGRAPFLVFAAAFLLGFFISRLPLTKVVQSKEALPAAGASTASPGASPREAGSSSSTIGLTTGGAGEETIYRQSIWVTILSVPFCLLGVYFFALVLIGFKQQETGTAKLSKGWSCFLVLVLAWGLISAFGEARKELKLDSQHFELDNQHIRFSDLTEIRWELRSTRRSRRYDLTCIKKSGEQEVVSLTSSWEPAVRDILGRARQAGVRVTEEERPGLFGWK